MDEKSQSPPPPQQGGYPVNTQPVNPYTQPVNPYAAQPPPGAYNPYPVPQQVPPPGAYNPYPPQQQQQQQQLPPGQVYGYPPPPTYGYVSPPHGGAIAVVVQDVAILGTQPTQMQCPACRQRILTSTKHEPGFCTWLSCACIAAFGGIFGCCLIPFVMEDFQDVEHYCPSCHAMIGRKPRL